MEKTVEQKKNAVLAHCEDVCNPEHRFKGVIVVRGETSFRMYVKNGGPQPNIYVLYKSKEVDPEIVEVFYSMLGISERDAVETYKASLQSDLKSMTAIVSSFKKGEQPDYVHVSKLGELQARNTALVAALERIKKEYGLEHGVLRGERPVINSLGEFINEVLEANTEKGGVQG